MILIAVILTCVVVTLVVLGLSIMTINKGYAYKQTVDPLPKKDEENKGDN